MPNTLAHLAAHGLAGRPLVRAGDLKWLYLGCVLPDLPWILQRLVRGLLPAVDAYALRLYAVAQASPGVMLLAAGALALLARRPRVAFAVLALNLLGHLLLDATEIKWANGVHLAAPVDWRLVRFDLFWPESPFVTVLSVAGVIFVAATWRRSVAEGAFVPRLPGKAILAAAGALAALWLALPLGLAPLAEAADNHFVATLRAGEARAGRPIELDRVRFEPGPAGGGATGRVVTFAGESIGVSGLDLARSAVVSLRGRFSTADRIAVAEWHRHRSGLRNAASYAGILLVLAHWLAAWRAGRSAPAARKT